MSKKYLIHSLGCRTNQYESEGFRNQLEEMGWAEVEEGGLADVVVVNTCTVTESADRESLYQVRHLGRRHPDAKIFVTGCSAEDKPETYLTLPRVHQVKGNKEKETLLAPLAEGEPLPEFEIDYFKAHTRAFVKVQDGCNSFCTYCIIPYVRGRSRSRTIDDVLEEVERLVKNGYKEVVLTGINIGDFEGGLAPLVKAVDQVKGLERLRLSSIDPDEVDDELAEAILNGTKTCPSLHLVLQSGSNVVLKRMNRKYTRQIFLETCKKMVEACPDFTFTTDVIVGFPGETEEDHEETLAIIKKVGFVKVHMFPFSKRKRTRAALYPDQVSPEIIQRRKAEVLRVSEEVAFESRNRAIGKRVTVLCEGDDGFGHTTHFLPVQIEGEPPPRNTSVEVILTKNTPAFLSGKVSI